MKISIQNDLDKLIHWFNQCIADIEAGKHNEKLNQIIANIGQSQKNTFRLDYFPKDRLEPGEFTEPPVEWHSVVDLIRKHQKQLTWIISIHGHLADGCQIFLDVRTDCSHPSMIGLAMFGVGTVDVGYDLKIKIAPEEEELDGTCMVS